MTHTFAREERDGTIRAYDVYMFWEIAQNLEVLETDLENVIGCINKYINNFNEDDWYRVLHADLSYPIILNDVSGILDGCHRAVKAMLLGHTTINAVRLNDLPKPTKVWNNWADYDSNP